MKTKTTTADIAHSPALSAPIPAATPASLTPSNSFVPLPITVFDYVIILCPNAGYQQGSFEEYGEDGLYIGGQARMQAAVDLYHNPQVTVRAFIVVGGGIDTDAATLWAKTDNMRQFLMQNGIPGDIVTCVASTPDTRGNFRAVWITCRKLLQGKTVGVLSNSYHLPRALLIATDAQFDWRGAELFPLEAEAYMTSTASIPPDHNPAVVGRLALERQGFVDWQNGTYTKQHAPISQWQGEVQYPKAQAIQTPRHDTSPSSI